MDRELAAAVTSFLEDARQSAPAPASGLVERIVAHLGDPDEVARLPTLREPVEAVDHVNLALALDAWAEADGHAMEIVGLRSPDRHEAPRLSILLAAAAGTRMWWGPPLDEGPVTLVNLPIGPGRSRPSLEQGVLLLERDGEPLVALLAGPAPQQTSVTFEVAAAHPDAAGAFLVELRAAMAEVDVFRGQVVQLRKVESEYGHARAAVVFPAMGDVARSDVVLREEVLARIERQSLGFASVSERLAREGRHLRRGVLLHGPPGTGKTHTIRYLLSAMEGRTGVVLTGTDYGLLPSACALARRLAPATVVLEDVDLIAEERDRRMGGGPLLFELLNEMDGIGEDADVLFVLTTNRADILEPALAQRPGRIDLAVELGLPGREERRRLLELYGRGLDLRLDDPEVVVARTEGVTASYVRELLRAAALRAALEGDGPVTDRHVLDAADELAEASSVLTRRLLGGEPSTMA